ncbi:HAD family hydrolase [Aliiglaciecola sp. NS0011-25]|uniref:HAD family hydrolase n=1 Tax=Aliiglaciecola sp. NS0011-25 TaxID=3127654 RepID=UPI00310ABD0E
MNLKRYKTLVFDCDGVILDSNKVKTEAFYKAALPYGEEAAKGLVDYHVARGGVSRYKKFEWFVDTFVKDNKTTKLDQLLGSYAGYVRTGLMECDVVDGLNELRVLTADANWLIVSGGDQNELREVFKKRNISNLFNGGIFGSPDNKDVILEREISSGNIHFPGLFLGDSKYDHEASTKVNLEFLFIAKWSEFSNWENYQKKHKFQKCDSIYTLI